MLVHALLLVPLLALHGFDPSAFIVAGDRFVSAGHTPVPIIVRPHSDGYDGQFYYRLALTPFLPRAAADGITLDHPAWRMQRILVPLVVHAAAFGNPAAMVWAFLAVNFIALFALAVLAARLACRLELSPIVPFAIAFWPAWLIALTHDTTEILAAALLFAGVAAYLARRMAAYAVLIALATLARETAVLAAAGIAAVELWCLVRTKQERRWSSALLAGAALLPFVAWRHHVAVLWQGSPQSHGLALNIGWPFLGWAEAAAANISNHAAGQAARPRNLLARVTMVFGMVLIGLFSFGALRAAWLGMRAGVARGVAAGWLLIFCLMAMLTANGPLVEPTAYLRAFAECWVVGWVILGATGISMPAPRTAALAFAFVFVRNWELCLLQLK